MLKGNLIQLRPVRRDDLDQVYSWHVDIANRGDYYPTGVRSQSEFYRRFEESGFWGKDDGMLLIVEQDDQIVGHIEFFKTVAYLDEYELSYQIYEPEKRGQGYTTEAVNLMVAYLFGRWKMNRIRLIIHRDNAASRRVAEKCGFTREGTARGAWYHQGRNHDVEVYALLRREWEEALGE
jgi:ribosomal-protein-alanine N-acetyltransferase